MGNGNGDSGDSGDVMMSFTWVSMEFACNGALRKQRQQTARFVPVQGLLVTIGLLARPASNSLPKCLSTQEVPRHVPQCGRGNGSNPSADCTYAPSRLGPALASLQAWVGSPHYNLTL